MTECGAVALDVGGVIYYDEPFELAWMQIFFAHLNREDPSVTITAFLDRMESFYLGGDDAAVRVSSHAARSWALVRESWGELAQPIPDSVDAVTSLARLVPVVVVANQPPESKEVLSRWGIEAACSALFLDSLVGVSKPDPSLLRLAVPYAGTADRLLVVGNRVDHDVRPAQRLGCRVAFVAADPDYRPPAGTHPALVTAHRRWNAERTAPPAVDEGVRTIASLAELCCPIDGPVAGRRGGVNDGPQPRP